MPLFGGGGSGRDIAIDLGTANTLVFERGRGIALSEPSVVAVDAESGSVQAVGDEARRMIGRTPATISAIRPLRHGVIADFEVTERMLRYFMRSVHPRPYPRSRVVMCAPSGVTEVEKRAVEEACLAAGARKVPSAACHVARTARSSCAARARVVRRGAPRVGCRPRAVWLSARAFQCPARSPAPACGGRKSASAVARRAGSLRPCREGDQSAAAASWQGLC